MTPAAKWAVDIPRSQPLVLARARSPGVGVYDIVEAQTPSVAHSTSAAGSRLGVVPVARGAHELLAVPSVLAVRNWAEHLLWAARGPRVHKQPDVAVADNNSVLVLPGQGDGALDAAATYAVGSYVTTIAAGDLNQDGLDDLVAAGSPGAVSVFLGLGKGMFGSRVDYPAGGAIASNTMADIDSDGFPDIVAVLEYSSVLVVMLNQHDGTFGTAVTYATGSTPMSAAAGDHDLNGYIDVVVASRDTSAVALFLNHSGTGVLERRQQWIARRCRARRGSAGRSKR